MKICHVCNSSGWHDGIEDYRCNRCNGFGVLYDNGGMIVPIDTDTNAPCLYCGQMTTWQVDGHNICEACTYQYRETLLENITQ